MAESMRLWRGVAMVVYVVRVLLSIEWIMVIMVAS
jgi:hypothetical protein